MRDQYTRLRSWPVDGTYARSSPFYIQLARRKARASKPVQFGKVRTTGVISYLRDELDKPEEPVRYNSSWDIPWWMK
jgi:hypothetical protein